MTNLSTNSSPRRRRVTVSKGIYERRLQNGQKVYDVEDAGAARGTFDDLKEAKAFKAELVLRRKRNESPISREEWLDARSRKVATSSGKPKGSSKARDVIAYLDHKVTNRSQEAIAAGSLSTEAGVFIEWLGEQADEPFKYIDADEADEFPDWLEKNRWKSSTQSIYLSYAHRLCAEAVRRKIVSTNPFDGVKPTGKETELDRKGNRRPDEDWRAWDVGEIVAAARALPARYLAVFWLCLLAMLRVGEAMGLQIRDYDPIQRTLYIRRQRRWSAKKSTSAPKSSAGRRKIPIGEALCRMLDQLIERDHPPRPSDEDELSRWEERFLLVGAKGGPMDRNSAVKAVRRSFELIGLSVNRTRFWYAPMHHLRKTMSSWAQDTVPARLGAALSYIMGHQTKRTTEFRDASPITTTAYKDRFKETNLRTWGQVLEVVQHIENLVSGELLPLLGTDDLLDVTCISDPMTPTEAADFLGTKHDGTPWTDQDVTVLIRNGEIKGLALFKPGHVSDGVLAASASDVRRYRAEQIRLQATTYSADDARSILRTDPRKLLEWVDAGYLTVDASSKRKRGNRGRGMTEPGGGYRFDRAEIDFLAELSAERFAYQDSYLTPKQAAALLGCEESTVRRLMDLGEEEGGIGGWVYESARGSERYIDPASAQRYLAANAAVPITEAAAGLGQSVAWIHAQIKLGKIRKTAPSRRPEHQRTVYLTDYQALGGPAGVGSSLVRRSPAA